MIVDDVASKSARPNLRHGGHVVVLEGAVGRVLLLEHLGGQLRGQRHARHDIGAQVEIESKT
jgi:hypothetical protein